MKVTWWIYRALTRSVSLRPINHKDLFSIRRDKDAELQLFGKIMSEKPRHWGRFAAYIDWLVQRYEPEEAYQQYQEMVQAMPHLAPRLIVFTIHCLVYIVRRWFLKRRHNQ